MAFLFIVLQPHSATAIVSPSHQTLLLNRWIASVEAEKNIDLYDWWKFREFYSPGSFTYDPQFLTPYSILQFHEVASEMPFMTFASEKLIAKESLYSKERCQDLQTTLAMTTANLESKNVILANPQTVLIFSPDLNELQLIFIRTFTDLKSVNQTIDYTTSEDRLTEHCWITQATIQAPKSWQPPATFP